MSEPFDPAKHLSNLKGSDYLEVKWRLVWLRDKHPDAVIETELIAHDERIAIFKATVSLPGPAGSATGFGSETPGDFKDYIEKAETKAIGRALGALGFGTQFSQDHEFGANAGKVVDAPVRRDAPPRDRSTSRNTLPDAPPSTQTPAMSKQGYEATLLQRISPGQLNVIQKHQNDLGWSVEDMKLIVAAHNYTTIKEFSTDQAMDLIKVMSDPAKADPYIGKLRNPQPATQAAMMANANLAERARQ